MPQPPRGRPRRPRPKIRSEISAGGVIYRRTPEGVAFGLIATKGRTRWQLPKGKQEPGETLEATAAREVAEETGLVGHVRAPLEAIDIWFSVNDGGRAVRRHKLVHFYLLEYRSGSTTDHDDEVDDASWFPADEALTLLTFPSERRVAARALEILADRDDDTDDQPARA
ncbi:MAG: NUDIX hydrolase [Deltaproteobacteria bacterium]|nr:NUDIX hydrolase [Deltaproteobacteria bacterium]